MELTDEEEMEETEVTEESDTDLEGINKSTFLEGIQLKSIQLETTKHHIGHYTVYAKLFEGLSDSKQIWSFSAKCSTKRSQNSCLTK